MGSLILFWSLGWVEMYESGGMRVKKITRYVLLHTWFSVSL